MTALYAVLIIIGILVFLYFAGGLAMALYLFVIGKRTNDEVLEHEIKDKKYDISLLDIPCEHLYILSRFGYKLHGRLYMAEKPTHKFIVDLHGRHSSSISQLKYLHIFTDLGYNVFVPDHRGCGESGGLFTTMGVYEKYDVMQWISVLKKKFPQAEFGIFGESMGAATGILATSMDSRIKVLVSYCAFSSVTDLVSDLAGNAFPKWLKIFLPALYLVSFFFFGVNVPGNDIAKAAEKVKVPMLVLHSYDDMLINIREARKILAANEKAEKVFFRGAAHARSYVEHPQEFSRAVTAFLKKHYPNE